MRKPAPVKLDLALFPPSRHMVLLDPVGVPVTPGPWIAARQVSLSFTISQSLLKLMSIESVIPSNHLILCCSLLQLPSVFPSIRVFSSESALRSDGKESACNARDPSLIPRLGRSTGEGIGYPLQYSWASLVAQTVKNPPSSAGDMGLIPRSER